MADKQYGLSFPTKKQLSAPKAGNVFGNDDDSEEEDGTDWVKKALKAENEKNKVKKQTKLNMQKALQEDPTIFQYDEVYDMMEQTKEEEKSAKKVEKKAKYIENLKKSAELRKKEQELRKDRMIQKEIEAEEAMFPDKERYVTSSYKAKLEEMKKFEEEQEYQDKLESIGDVTKQRDMSGFYRHLFRQKVERNEADLGIVSKPAKVEESSDTKLPTESNIDKDDPIPSDLESENEGSKSDNDKPNEVIKSSSISKNKRKRQYRKKVQEASESESESDHEVEKPGSKTDETKAIDNPRELQSPTKIQKLDDSIVNEKENEKTKLEENENVRPNDKESKTNSDNSTKNNSETKIKEEEPKKIKEKVKINIWEKRTVGAVFEAALQRYLQRKEERLTGC